MTNPQKKLKKNKSLSFIANSPKNMEQRLMSRSQSA